MTEIEIIRDKSGKIYEFRSEGHTGYAQESADIVCAGVSALLQTAILGLEEYLKLDPQVEQEKGYLICRVERDYFLNRELDAMLETMLLGLRALEREYPRHLRVQEKIKEASSDVRV